MLFVTGLRLRNLPEDHIHSRNPGRRLEFPQFLSEKLNLEARKVQGWTLAIYSGLRKSFASSTSLSHWDLSVSCFYSESKDWILPPLMGSREMPVYCVSF